MAMGAVAHCSVSVTVGLSLSRCCVHVFASSSNLNWRLLAAVGGCTASHASWGCRGAVRQASHAAADYVQWFELVVAQHALVGGLACICIVWVLLFDGAASHCVRFMHTHCDQGALYNMHYRGCCVLYATTKLLCSISTSCAMV